MFVMVIYRYLTLVSLTYIFCTLLHFLKNTGFAALTVLIFCLIEALIFHFIPLNSVFGILRGLNLFTIFNLNIAFFTYHNLILCGHAFNLRDVITIAQICTIAGALLLALSFKTQKRVPFHLPPISFKFGSHASLFYHELINSLFHYRAIYFLVLFALYLCLSFNSYQNCGQNRNYENLVRRFGGPIDAEKIAAVTAYHQEIERSREELTALEKTQKEGKIDYAAYYEKNVELNSKLAEAGSLWRIDDSIEHARGKKKAIVFDDGFALLFDRHVNNSTLNGTILNYLVTLIVLILTVSTLYADERYQDSNYLYRTCRNYRLRVAVKHTLAVFYCFLITLAYSFGSILPLLLLIT